MVREPARLMVRLFRIQTRKKRRAGFLESGLTLSSFRCRGHLKRRWSGRERPIHLTTSLCTTFLILHFNWTIFQSLLGISCLRLTPVWDLIKGRSKMAIWLKHLKKRLDWKINREKCVKIVKCKGMNTNHAILKRLSMKRAEKNTTNMSETTGKIVKMGTGLIWKTFFEYIIGL